MPGVVFQVNEAGPDKHRMVLGNIRNVKKEMPDLVIELVVHGAGIGLVTADHSTVRTEIAELQADGVCIAVCQNTMNRDQLTAADLLPGMTVVRAGIAHLIQRQQAGYSYVKP